jgi:hypothetical protein
MGLYSSPRAFAGPAGQFFVRLDVRKSGQSSREFDCPFTSVFSHVWTALLWQGLFDVLRYWSVRPCVRPVDAVFLTAGHNAFR